MGLDAVIRDGIALAKTVTADLQDTVTHEAWIGKDDYAKPTFDTAVSHPAIVNLEPKGSGRAVRTDDAEVLPVQAEILILEPISENGASGRTEPVDKRDRFTLPDGRTGPIISAPGVVDPSTDAPYMFQILLGY